MSTPTLPWRRFAAEFVIIFAGVALGLLADDWRQSREDAVRERVVLAEILADLEADSVALAAVEGRGRAWDEAGLWVSRHEGVAVEMDSAVSAIRGAWFYTAHRPQRAAYVSLRDGGELDLLRSDALRRRIVEYFEYHQPYAGILLENAEVHYLHARTVWSPYQRFGAPDDSESLMDRTSLRLRAPWAEVSRDPELTGALVTQGLFGGGDGSEDPGHRGGERGAQTGHPGVSGLTSAPFYFATRFRPPRLAL